MPLRSSRQSIWHWLMNIILASRTLDLSNFTFGVSAGKYILLMVMSCWGSVFDEGALIPLRRIRRMIPRLFSSKDFISRESCTWGGRGCESPLRFWLKCTMALMRSDEMRCLLTIKWVKSKDYTWITQTRLLGLFHGSLWFGWSFMSLYVSDYYCT
jgi:hypothetical protein